MTDRCIELRGVEVHNLKQVDLDVPHGRLVVFCGVSGSGKTSLALDTLYAEGQRRYIESFSAYTRQFLEQLDKPAAERIDNIPPAVAVTRKTSSRSHRATVGSVTETADYLRLLFAKIARTVCRSCGSEVRRDTPQIAANQLNELDEGARLMICFARPLGEEKTPAGAAEKLKEEGYVRVVAGGATVSLADFNETSTACEAESRELLVVVDRLTAGSTDPRRLRDSLETAMQAGGGSCRVLAACGEEGEIVKVDGRSWRRLGFSSSLRCEECGIDYLEPEPKLFSFNSAWGACPACEGFGSIMDVDMDLVVPNRGKSLREGAVAPWNTPAYEHELQELLALAGDYQLPVDVPFSELDETHLKIVTDGVAERDFGGLSGFFAWLERRKYKTHLRAFLSRWKIRRPCEACGGARLREEALAAQVGGKNIAEIYCLKVDEARDFFDGLSLTDWERQVGRAMLGQVAARLDYLSRVGVGYLALDRTLRTLSGGEAQRVALTSSLGSSLVNMLYVLDEPTAGLHPRDVQRLIDSIGGLRDRGNTVVVVEHEEAMIEAADRVVEIGPEAGVHGGRVVFEGTPRELRKSTGSLTADYLCGRRGLTSTQNRRDTQRGWIQLTGARGNNLQNITVKFPLGVLCLVTGVSGSGKSTLVQDTLYGALCQRMRKDSPRPEPFDDVFGDGQIDDVMLVDQSPIARSPRSNPVTYIKAFDQIRAVFADTLEARTHNYTAGHFSFNVEGGRCDTCKGDGYLEIDMQFLADVFMRCGQCGGKRYRREILEVTYRGRTIADVLEMTVREAFSFFRGQTKAQARLKRLIDVGLDYLRLGQAANTLSAGEAQRLKLASHMAAAKRSRTLFLLDEPTTGLHFSDVVKLIDCFDALLAVGHSLIVVEHSLQLMKAADYIIDLGPGAADQGGRVVATGSPEQIAACDASTTGEFLGAALAAEARQRSA